MEAHSSSAVSLRLQGDFAAGLRTNPEAVIVRGSFGTGMSGTARPHATHHGDFAGGIRAHLHHHAVPLGDFAVGLRAQPSSATSA